MTEYTPQLGQKEEVAHRRPNYLFIFALLAGITLVEVTVAAEIPFLLIVLSISKIVLVAMYYMHLRFTNAWFTAIFVSPLPFVLLITVALIAALAPEASSLAASGFCSVW